MRSGSQKPPFQVADIADERRPQAAGAVEQLVQGCREQSGLQSRSRRSGHQAVRPGRRAAPRCPSDCEEPVASETSSGAQAGSSGPAAGGPRADESAASGRSGCAYRNGICPASTPSRAARRKHDRGAPSSGSAEGCRSPRNSSATNRFSDRGPGSASGTRRCNRQISPVRSSTTNHAVERPVGVPAIQPVEPALRNLNVETPVEHLDQGGQLHREIDLCTISATDGAPSSRAFQSTCSLDDRLTMPADAPPSQPGPNLGSEPAIDVSRSRVLSRPAISSERRNRLIALPGPQLRSRRCHFLSRQSTT